LSLGTDFTIVLSEHGDLYGFGSNRNGQLGLGTTNNQLLPALLDKVHVFAGENVASVSCGHSHTACVTNNDRLFVWGCGEQGQLGVENFTSVTDVTTFTDAPPATVVNTVTTASTNTPGALPLPLPGAYNVMRPVLVHRKSFNNAPVRMVACGKHHTLVLTKRGAVYSTGVNNKGQLGLNDTMSRRIFTEIDPVFFADNAITLIAAGNQHNMVLSAPSGALFAFGCNSWNQLGLGPRPPFAACAPVCIPTPVHPDSFGSAKPIFMDAGDGFSMVVTSDGALYGCGMNARCQLGLGDHACPPFMKRLGETGKFNGQRVRSVRCGSVHTLILTHDNTLWACGLATDPLCGTHAEVAGFVKVPARIRHARFHGNDVVVFAAGVSHSAAITSTGELYTWGAGVCYPRSNEFKFSALGHNNRHVQWLPRKVCTASLGGARVGGWHTIRHDILLAFVMVTHKRLGDRSVFQSVLWEIIHVVIAPVCAPNTPGGFQDLLGRLQ